MEKTHSFSQEDAILVGQHQVQGVGLHDGAIQQPLLNDERQVLKGIVAVDAQSHLFVEDAVSIASHAEP